jgi:secreted PhoX family phosphatase
MARDRFSPAPAPAHDRESMHNPCSNVSFKTLFARRLSRRECLERGFFAAAFAALPGALAGCSDDDLAELAQGTGELNPTVPSGPPTLGFAPVPKGLDDFIRVPDGYRAVVLTALGDPIDAALSDYANDGTDGDFARRIGDHGDALMFFPYPKGSGSSSDGLLVQNHEALTDTYLHPSGPTNSPFTDKTATLARPLAEIEKEQQAHGISLVHITKGGDGRWQVDRSFAGNTRWHVNTEFLIAGPAAGTAQMITKLSPAGDRAFGTLNNCGNGYTPWGTYLSGEENWASYFRRGDDAALDAVRDARLSRQGIAASNVDATAETAPSNYRGWDRADTGGDLQKRFDCTASAASAADDFRNEPNHFGYVVELDPYEPAQIGKKRTALGRGAHEGAWFGPVVEGEPLVVYMGDDSRNEYLYKYVSNAAWSASDATLGLGGGDKYLDDGKLDVAQFADDGSGEWLLLSKDNPALEAFENLADIVINARQAADAAGATKMDRPEWGGVNPQNGEFYVSLTNNSTRGTTGPAVDAPNPRSYAEPRGETMQTGNPNGHILRLREADSDNAATTFSWDVYLFGAQADADPATVNLSGLGPDNDFSSPDGLWFDTRGVLWIQTDDGAYADVTNCMMLAALPGEVGDGGEVMVGGQRTHVGKAATTDTLKRFLVGVPGSEITGVDLTPDNKTLFVCIQHPGESGSLTEFQSNWPAASGADATQPGYATNRPRTATIAITRIDGGDIGA